MSSTPSAAVDPARVVVGVDGGNSKTDVVLADLDGRILAEVRDDGTRPHLVGVPATAAMVAGAIARAREQAHIGPGPLRAGAFHWANLDTAPMELSARAEVERLRLCTDVVVTNDTFAVLRAGTDDGWGVAVVSGAGVNALGVAPDGSVARFLALGDVTGDWGGGSAIGTAGLGAAVRAGDGRGVRTVLRERLAGALGVSTVEDAAIALSENRMDAQRLIEIAPVVTAAAQEGDEAALRIVRRQAEEIVTMCTALLGRLGLLDAPVTVVLGGGTVQWGPPVLHDLICGGLAERAPHATARPLDVRPVAGSVFAALDVAGAEPAAFDRIRSNERMAPR